MFARFSVLIGAIALLSGGGLGVGYAVRDARERHTPIVLTQFMQAADDVVQTLQASQPASVPTCPSVTAVEPAWMDAGPLAPAVTPVTPLSLERRVVFWSRVWGEMPDNTHLLVDQRRPWVVHAEVDCRDLYAEQPADAAKASCGMRIAGARKTAITKLKKHWSAPAILRRYDGDRALAKTADDNFIAIQGRKDALTRAKDRAAAHLGHTEGLFAMMQVPRIYARAAIVESLWRPEALSRSGAAGAYQFMPRTGAQYLQVQDGVVDERLDPLRASYAAARYMHDMQRQLQHWPLVITAYNTGPARLKRVMQARKTQDLGKIADAGDFGEFGFDGQNYYAQIVAIGRLTLAEPFEPVPITGRAFRLNEAARFADVAACNDVRPDILALANPALHDDVIAGKTDVPKGYVTYLPDARAQTAFALQPR